MFRIPVILALLVIGLQAAAADKKFPVAAIPDHISKGAHAVKRTEQVRLEIVNTSKVVVKKYYAITVFDDAGIEYAELNEYYDKLRKIENIEGWMYDAAGNEIRRLKNKEVLDRSAISDISIYEDSRIKYHSFSAPSLPYTVAYEVAVEYNNSFMLDPWIPQDDELLGVEDSRLTVVSPAGYQVRFRNFNYPEAPVKSMEGSKQVMTWQVKNLKPFEKPFASPIWNELTTAVYLAPSEFEIEGYKGVMNTWNDLGKFHAALNKGRDVLPPAIQQQVDRIAAANPTTRQKAEALYHFLQQNTRYISIQLGLGGWQPFEASFVAQKGYGDCKALSNYMYSLLKGAGIRSHYVLIMAGDRGEARRLIEDFPMKQSNHAILCVPLEKDTLWLECTSQTDPAGYMGSFTGNRKALLITEEGGVLVSTPRYGINENQQVRKTVGTIDETGNLTASVSTVYTGMLQDKKQAMLVQASKDELKKHLNDGLSLATYNIKDFRYKQQSGLVPQVEEQLDLEVSRYANISGKRLFIAPNLMSREVVHYNADSTRTLDFVFDHAFRVVDTAVFELPKGYTPEAIPQPVSLKTAFATFSSWVRVEGTKIMFFRTREHFAGRLPASQSQAVAQFFAAMAKADNNRVVLVKNEL